MGLIDNDNNVITVDAVLTDLGRERIARNDGSFQIVRFTFGDDEINYKLFTPNTGSLQQDTKILNTPILEASVNETIAIKSHLMTISNPNLKYLPILEASIASLTLGERVDSQVGKFLEFKQRMQTSGRVVSSEIVDPVFMVQVNNDLLFVEKETPVSVDSYGLARYVLPRTAIGADQGSSIRFSIIVQALTSDLWSTLGTGTVGSRTITTTVRCQGMRSGLYEETNVTINEEFQR